MFFFSNCTRNHTITHTNPTIKTCSNCIYPVRSELPDFMTSHAYENNEMVAIFSPEILLSLRLFGKRSLASPCTSLHTHEKDRTKFFEEFPDYILIDCKYLN